MQSFKKLSLLRVSVIFLLGLVSGIQISLYLMDYYEDGIADITSLYIGLAMIILSYGYVLYSFRNSEKKESSK